MIYKKSNINLIVILQIEPEDSLSTAKRKPRDSDDVEKALKKPKFNTNCSSAPITTPTSVPSTPPSSSNSSSAARSYDQSSNRYDTNYNHHRNRSTPYSRSDNRSDSRR